MLIKSCIAKPSLGEVQLIQRNAAGGPAVSIECILLVSNRKREAHSSYHATSAHTEARRVFHRVPYRYPTRDPVFTESGLVRSTLHECQMSLILVQAQMMLILAFFEIISIVNKRYALP